MMDWTQAAADLAVVRGDNQISLTLRRGSTTLAAQSARIAQKGAGSETQGIGTRASGGRVVVLFGTTGNVQVGDRFNDAAGVLYEVVYVRTNRRAAVTAEAEVVE
jgi:hypothetical protein